MHASFAQALLSPEAVGSDEASRFNVYRNNLRITLHNALQTSFPAVETLVGEAYFSALTLVYVERHPPKSPIMSGYGDDFAAFLAEFDPLRDYPYLADVARIEFARIQAYHAADAAPFGLDDDRSAIAALDTRAGLHPSVTIIDSKTPALSIWRAQVEPDALPPVPEEKETAIIWRQGDQVAEIVANADDAVLLNHFAGPATFTALMSNYPDHLAAETLIARFINLAIAGIIVPAYPNIEGELK